MNRLHRNQTNELFFFFFFPSTSLWSSEPRRHLERQQQEEGPLRGVVALQDLPSSLCEERGGVFALLAPHHALAVMEIVAANARAVAGQVTGGEEGGPSADGRRRLRAERAGPPTCSGPRFLSESRRSCRSLFWWADTLSWRESGRQPPPPCLPRRPSPGPAS